MKGAPNPGTLWIDPEAINLSDRIIAGGRG